MNESGHMPYAEEPEAFEYAVRHFIDHTVLGEARRRPERTRHAESELVAIRRARQAGAVNRLDRIANGLNVAVRICLMVEGQEGVEWEQWLALARSAEYAGLEGSFVPTTTARLSVAALPALSMPG